MVGRKLKAISGGSPLPNEVFNASPHLLFFSTAKLIKRSGYDFGEVELDEPLERALPWAQNVFAAIEARIENCQLQITANSGRIGRARVYYTFQKEELHLSNDLRELIPYTTRKVNATAAYSVIKFGDVPERITVVEGIYSIPVGTFLFLSEGELVEAIEKGRFELEQFRPFFRLAFPMDGGDISGTQRLLESEFAAIARMRPLVAVSGGVDSTLINRLIDRAATEQYPAYFVQFTDADPERDFALRAVAGTKADLQIALFRPENTIDAFEYQGAHLVTPIGESSTISTAHFFRTFGGNGHRVVDGTLADGCYGSANYSRGVLEGIAEKPQWQLRLNELISVFLRENGLPGRDRFHPRDSMINNPLFRFMSMYIGPYANVWFNDAARLNRELEPIWLEYFDYLSTEHGHPDEWARYSVFKMVNYASRNNTAKSFDMARPGSTGIYPFMWLAVLQDQGHYKWYEKVPNGMMKFPLKKILEAYMPHDFIYRKKVGLNSCFEDWIYTEPIRSHFLGHLNRPGGIVERLMGEAGLRKLVKRYLSGPTDIYTTHLIINLAIFQNWMDHNNVHA